MKIYSCTLLLALFFSFRLFAQSMLGYSDPSGDFYIYDTDRAVHLDHLKPKSVQPAANSIAYVDNTGELKYYARHDLRDLQVNNPGFYINTDYYLFYSTADVFSVYDGVKKRLLGYIGQYPFAFGDSIAAMHDYTNYFFAYWKNNFVELEHDPAKLVVAGDNILAYVDHLQQFKIFYHGEKYDVDEYPPFKIKAGAGTVMYIDNFKFLKIFCDGTTYELYNVGDITCTATVLNPVLPDYCDNEVVSSGGLPLFEAGDEVAAYIDDQDHFHVFSKGKNIIAEQQAPQKYEVTDNMIYWIDNNNFFKVFYDGEIQTVESYEPKTIKADKNIVSYTDVDGRLKAFYKGDVYPVSANIVRDYNLNNAVLMYTETQNIYKFFTFE